MLQCLHLEVRRTHPGFDRTERMLDRLAPQRDFIGPLIEPLLYALEDGFVLPPPNATLFAGGALGLDRAASTSIRPV